MTTNATDRNPEDHRGATTKTVERVTSERIRIKNPMVSMPNKGGKRQQVARRPNSNANAKSDTKAKRMPPGNPCWLVEESHRTSQRSGRRK